MNDPKAWPKNWEELAKLTTESFSPSKPSAPTQSQAVTVSQSAPQAQAQSPLFSTSREQYKPALQNNPTLTAALSRLQQMRQSHQKTNHSPRVVTSSFRAGSDDFIRVDRHTPARVHPPKKP